MVYDSDAATVRSLMALLAPLKVPVKGDRRVPMPESQVQSAREISAVSTKVAESSQIVESSLSSCSWPGVAIWNGESVDPSPPAKLEAATGQPVSATTASWLRPRRHPQAMAVAMMRAMNRPPHAATYPPTWTRLPLPCKGDRNPRTTSPSQARREWPGLPGR